MLCSQAKFAPLSRKIDEPETEPERGLGFRNLTIAEDILQILNTYYTRCCKGICHSK